MMGVRLGAGQMCGSLCRRGGRARPPAPALRAAGKALRSPPPLGWPSGILQAPAPAPRPVAAQPHTHLNKLDPRIIGHPLRCLRRGPPRRAKHGAHEGPTPRPAPRHHLRLGAAAASQGCATVHRARPRLELDQGLWWAGGGTAVVARSMPLPCGSSSSRDVQSEAQARLGLERASLEVGARWRVLQYLPHSCRWVRVPAGSLSSPN